MAKNVIFLNLRDINLNFVSFIILTSEQECNFGADGAHPPGRDGVAERGREHDAAAEAVVGQVCLILITLSGNIILCCLNVNVLEQELNSKSKF